LARSEAPSLAHFVRSLVGMDRSAAQAAFSQFLNDRSLTAQQIRFVEMVIDQLTARGVMDASPLYEPPFSNLHAGGPDELFAGKETVINAVLEVLRSFEPPGSRLGRLVPGTGTTPTAACTRPFVIRANRWPCRRKSRLGASWSLSKGLCTLQRGWCQTRCNTRYRACGQQLPARSFPPACQQTISSPHGHPVVV
jgi:hypothetical protein